MINLIKENSQKNQNKMGTAKRLYGKKLDPFGQETVKMSCFFRSKVERRINKQPESNLGPGQYQISLPLVRPNFQTIMKNDNTVIVKFNSHGSNAFQSKSPRFKYCGSQLNKRDSSHEQAKYKYEIQSVQKSNHQNEQRLARELSRSLLICQMQQNKVQSLKGPRTMKKIIPKVYRQNSTKKKTIAYTTSMQQHNHNSKNPQVQTQHRTLPLASRLHNLEPNMIETKRLQSNRYNSSVKSTEWSKYKLQRRCFVDELVVDDQPGPGAYPVKEPKFRGYNQRAGITSWQFNSKTSRTPFELGYSDEKGKTIFFNDNHRNDSSSKYKLSDQAQERQRKEKILKKKVSRQRIFGLIRREENADRYLSLQFTAIHSRENLFVEK